MIKTYLDLSDIEFTARINALDKNITQCALCNFACKINRSKGQTGVCGATDELYIINYGLHGSAGPYLKEIPRPQGIIFFPFCNASCVFCQSYQISQNQVLGRKISIEQLTDIMLELQEKNCTIIDLVSPTHYVPMIAKAIYLGKKRGLKATFAYNTNSYDRVETLKLLKDIIKIYLPDIKFANNDTAKKYTRLPKYWDAARAGIKEMFRQVRVMQIDEAGNLQGIEIRHLLMPNHISEAKKIIDFIMGLSSASYLRIMAQYNPIYKANMFPEINCPISEAEYTEICDYVAKKQMVNTSFTGFGFHSQMAPDFSLENPFPEDWFIPGDMMANLPLVSVLRHAKK